MHSLRKFTGKANVWHAGFAPHQIRIRCIRHTTADGLLQTVFHAVEALWRALAGEERLVVGIVIAGDQVSRFGIGASQNDGGHAHHVSRKTCSNQLLAGFLRRHEHLAAHVAALFDRSELVFKVNA